MVLSTKWLIINKSLTIVDHLMQNAKGPPVARYLDPKIRIEPVSKLVRQFICFDVLLSWRPSQNELGFATCLSGGLSHVRWSRRDPSRFEGLA